MTVSLTSPRGSGVRPADLKPASVLARSKPHGTRIKYVGGCRCRKCRDANRDYERVRQAARAMGASNGLVAADKARRHLEKLQNRVGLRRVSELSKVPRTILQKIRSGKKTQIRARTERRITQVRVDQLAGRTRIPVGPTLRRVKELKAAGIPEELICYHLGLKGRYLQLQPSWITVTKAHRIEQLHALWLKF